MGKLKPTTMRRLHLIIVLFILLGATLVTLGLRSVNRNELQTETAGPEIDRPVMLCI